MTEEDPPNRNVLLRGLWLVAGLLAVGVGALGIVVPGLPTTGFFILAAWCFSKSSRRMEAWVLALPGIGPMVQDYRDGLGMPRRAKALAITMMILFGVVGALLLIDNMVAKTIVLVAVAIGTYWVGWRVPTREQIVAERGLDW